MRKYLAMSIFCMCLTVGAFVAAAIMAIARVRGYSFEPGEKVTMALVCFATSAIVGVIAGWFGSK